MTKTVWRDVSKTTKTGLTFPEYRLKMPNGEAVLKLDKGAVFDASDHSQYIFHVRCFSAGIASESTGERDPDKAKKAAVDILRRRMQTTIAEYQENLAALQNVVSRDRPQDTSKPASALSVEPPKNEPALSTLASKMAASEPTAKKIAPKKTTATKNADAEVKPKNMKGAATTKKANDTKAVEPKPARKRGLRATEKAEKNA